MTKNLNQDLKIVKMCSRTVLSLIILILELFSIGNADIPPDIAIQRVNKLSDQIRIILEHYKNPDPVGIPGVPIPDPMPVPNLKHDISFAGRLEIKNATVNGLSKFRIESFYSNLADMQVQVVVYIEKLEVLGNYTLGTWLSKRYGGCNVTLSDVYIQGIAKLEVSRLGNLEASDINMDIVVNNIELDFQNLGFLASIFQGAINTIGPFILDSIKPFILGVINNDIRQNVNKNLKGANKTFPNSLPPIDIAIAEGRKMVRNMGYDPYKIDDYNYSIGIFSIDVTQVWIKGLASFYRIGNLTILMENNTIHIAIETGTQQLMGNCQWEISSTSIFSKPGKSSFTVEYIHVKAKVNQSLDIRQQPILADLQLELGNIQLRSDGTGTLDYLLEAAVNILPNILRYQIMDAIEQPLRRKVQDILDSYDFENMIEEKLPELDNLQNQMKNISSSPVKTYVEKLSEEGLHVEESEVDNDEIFN